MEKEFIFKTFLSKLYGVLNNPLYQQIITWEPSGKRILIRNQVILEKEILPKEFGIYSFGQFLQQLLCFGFQINQNSSSSDQIEILAQGLFQRGQQNCLQNNMAGNSSQQNQQKKSEMIQPPIKTDKEVNDINQILQKEADIERKLAALVKSNNTLFLQNNKNWQNLKLFNLNNENKFNKIIELTKIVLEQKSNRMNKKQVDYSESYLQKLSLQQKQKLSKSFVAYQGESIKKKVHINGDNAQAQQDKQDQLNLPNFQLQNMQHSANYLLK